MPAVTALGTARPARSPHQLAQGLYERHHKRILGFCIRRLATREEAEDAVQTTYLYALRALERGVRPVSETAWLFKIAENVCLATHRTNGRRRSREVAEPLELEDRAGDRELGREEQRELLRALGTISENQRKALLLREWRGLSYREISAHLGVSVGAVETLIFRARKGMAKALSETGVRGRLAGIADLGAGLNALKTALGGSATLAKLAATAAVVTLATIPAGDAAVPSKVGAIRSQSPALPSATLPAAQPAAVIPMASGERRSVRPATKSRTAAIPDSNPGRPATPPADASGGGSGSSVPAASSVPTVPQVPAPPVAPVNLPSAPTLPSVPTVPELPQLPEVPPPSLPVELPDLTGDLPSIPPVLP